MVEPVLVVARSALGVIVVVTLELVGVPSLLVVEPLLLRLFGSGVADRLRAVLLMVLSVAGATKLTVRGSVAPFASVATGGNETMPVCAS